MKVLKIEQTDAAAAEQKSFKGRGIKLNKSGLKINKQLTGDTFELRKPLPDNKTAKEHGYFGNPNIGNSSNEYKSYDDENPVKLLLIWGAAIAAAALM